MIGCVYRYPSNTDEQDDEFNNWLLEASNLKASHMVIMGDFTHLEVYWTEVKSTKADNHKASKFLEMIKDYFWTQNIIEPTHYRGCQTPNTLDLVFINEKGLIENVQTESPLGKSHHKINFNIRSYIQKKTKSITNSVTYDRGEYNSMRQYMAKIERDQIMKKKNLEETWETFEKVLNDAVKKYIPSKRITSGAKQRTTPTPEMEKTIRNMPKQKTKLNGNLSEISKGN